MGIPRFYRWYSQSWLFRLKNRYPQIRMDLKDTTKQLPLIDNLYLDFNGLIYRCIRVKLYLIDLGIRVLSQK